MLERLEQQLWPEGERRETWMVVDGARDRRIFGMLVDSYLEYACLYGSAVAPELEVVAPHLVRLDYQDRYSRRLLENGWGLSWGVFLKSNTGMDRLLRHLRRLLKVRDQRGKTLMFRYYDPRVLRAYLPTCTAEELRAVFGPIECIWTEHEDPGTLLEFRVDHGRLNRVERSLVAPVQTTERMRSGAG